MSIQLTNNASSLLAAPILATDTLLTVASADAALFPQPVVTGDYFRLVLEDRRVVPNLREIVTCTARSGAALTIIRAQEGTTAQNFFTGGVVSLRITAGTLTALIAEEAALRSAADAAEAAARSAADAAEAAARSAADAAEAAARATAITNEQSARITADATETLARIAADSAEITARTAAIAVVNAVIAAEQALRISGDSTLNTALLAETAARIAADNNLNAAIIAEQTRALAAEAVLAAGGGGVAKGGTGLITAASTITVTFTTPFASTVESVLINKTSTDPYGERILLGTKSTTGFTVTTSTDFSGSGGTGMTFDWIAAGT